MAERLSAVEARLAKLEQSQRGAFERIEAQLASIDRWRARAESAEQRLRELGEQTTFLIEELSEARRWLHARGDGGGSA